MGRRRDGVEEEVFDVTGVDPAKARGAWTPELVEAATAMGFHTGAVWYPLEPGDEAGVQEQFDALIADLQDGVPSIVCMRLSDAADAGEHFRLVLGYDADEDVVVFHDPALDDGAYWRMSGATFRHFWPLTGGEKGWSVVRVRLEGTPVAPAPPRGPQLAELAQTVRALELPVGYTGQVASPWVVVGDEGAEQLDRHVRGTVRWATRHLEAELFPSRPAAVWTVWLHSGPAPYESYSLARFGELPGTPYGYARDGELVMDISTGAARWSTRWCTPTSPPTTPTRPPGSTVGWRALSPGCAFPGRRWKAKPGK